MTTTTSTLWRKLKSAFPFPLDLAMIAAILAAVAAYSGHWLGAFYLAAACYALVAVHRWLRGPRRAAATTAAAAATMATGITARLVRTAGRAWTRRKSEAAS